MKIKLIAVGTRMPVWVEAGTQEYSKRLPKDFELNIIDIPLSNRGKAVAISRAIAREGEAMLAAIGKQDRVIALDVLGQSITTEKMAEKFSRFRDEGENVSLLIGGPDGLAESCLLKADEKWSLSALTFPHPLVRIVIVEQLYRVWSFLNNHPYHRI